MSNVQTAMPSVYARIASVLAEKGKEIGGIAYSSLEAGCTKLKETTAYGRVVESLNEVTNQLTETHVYKAVSPSAKGFYESHKRSVQDVAVVTATYGMLGVSIPAVVIAGVGLLYVESSDNSTRNQLMDMERVNAKANTLVEIGGAVFKDSIKAFDKRLDSLVLKLPADQRVSLQNSLIDKHTEIAKEIMSKKTYGSEGEITDEAEIVETLKDQRNKILDLEGIAGEGKKAI